MDVVPRVLRGPGFEGRRAWGKKGIPRQPKRRSRGKRPSRRRLGEWAGESIFAIAKLMFCDVQRGVVFFLLLFFFPVLEKERPTWSSEVSAAMFLFPNKSGTSKKSRVFFVGMPAPAPLGAPPRKGCVVKWSND